MSSQEPEKAYKIVLVLYRLLTRCSPSECCEDAHLILLRVQR